MVRYRDLLHEAMLGMGDSGYTRFVGYNTAYGHKMNGTLAGCEHLCIETPVAENLMVGIATGLSLAGYFPILCFERMDFMLAGMDALINHLAGLQQYGMKVPMIIRAVVGDDRPLDPGSQHTQDYSEWFKKTKLPVAILDSCARIKEFYAFRPLIQPFIAVEYRRLYDQIDETAGQL